MKRKLALLLILVMAISSLTFTFADDSDTENEIEVNYVQPVYGFDVYVDFFMTYITQYYYKDVTGDQVIEAMYKGIFSSLDKHSVYLPKKDYNDYTEKLSGEFYGIGINIAQKGDYIEVTSPVPGSPGEKAGFMSGDLIIKVDGQDLATMTYEKAVSLMRGEKGAPVTLTVKRGNTEMSITVIRDLITVSPVVYEMKGDVLYVKLSLFSEQATKEFIAAMTYGVSNGAEKLIIDLRNNPGGLLTEAKRIADLFLDDFEPIVKIDYKNQKDEFLMATAGKYDFETVILVNEGSASASEIVSSALQDNDAATIIGETTYGKGTVQNIIPLINGDAFKLTIAEYLRPSLKTIDGVGVIPDIYVDDYKDEIAESLDTLAPMNESKSYSLGMVGLNAYGAQQRLNLIGYQLDADGMYGVKTVEAIKAFQAMYGLPQSGVLNESTKMMLINVVDNMDTMGKDVQLEKALEVLN